MSSAETSDVIGVPTSAVEKNSKPDCNDKKTNLLRPKRTRTSVTPIIEPETESEDESGSDYHEGDELEGDSAEGDSAEDSSSSSEEEEEEEKPKPKEEKVKKARKSA